jgi:DNA polymerase-1
MSKRVLLIDADVLAYEAASGCEKATEWEPGYWTWHCSFEDVKAHFDRSLEVICDTLKGDPVLCLTDSLGNFRFSVLPTYKGNRKGQKKPLVLTAFKEHLIENHGAYFRPGLEGDDCMGILATRANPTGEERVIVSVDKDMKTIPGLVCRWPIEKEPREVTLAQADYWHLYQTLMGDTTDGYAGCPGIGKVTVEKVLGPEPGHSEEFDVAGTYWPAVVDAFAKSKGKLTEADALVQARVARILRASDYDFQKKEPKLWKP